MIRRRFLVAGVSEHIADNQIVYVTTDHNKLAATSSSTFDSLNLGYVANEYTMQKGVLTYPSKLSSIGDYFFSYCTKLKTVTLPNTIKSIGGRAFEHCENMEGDFSIPNDVTSIGDYAFFHCYKLTYIRIPSNVTNIGQRAFSNCTAITRLILPEGVKSIEANTCNKCAELRVVVIPSSVTNIAGSAFGSCTSLKDITIPCAENVTINSTAFTGCTNIPTVTANSYRVEAFSWLPSPKNVKTLKMTDICEAIVANAFSTLTSLEEVFFGKSIKTVGTNAFSNNTNLKSVHITDVAAWCKIAFGNAQSNPMIKTKNLYVNGELAKNLVIPFGVTSIGAHAFQYGECIETVSFSEGLERIGDNAFYRCSQLTALSLPDSVTQIDYEAFSYCTKLTAVHLGEQVELIESYAFSFCTNLKTIYCKAANPPSININSFSGLSVDCVVYVPTDALNAYQSASEWSKFNLQPYNF